MQQILFSYIFIKIKVYPYIELDIITFFFFFTLSRLSGAYFQIDKVSDICLMMPYPEYNCENM